jgi:hypothetical protein
VDQATKAGLLDLLEQACGQGWTVRGACQVLEVNELRIYRWLHRRAAGELPDQPPGAADAWPAGLGGHRDHRAVRRVGRGRPLPPKLAHRGSYLGRVWVSPASVRRVLERQGLRLRPLPRPGAACASRSPTGSNMPQLHLDLRHDHFTRAGVAATVVEELVSRTWLAEIVSVEETSTQVQVVFTQALEREELLERVSARQDGLVDPTIDDPSRPVLLALSDNGPQMTSGSTREFMALCAIHQHFGRPGTPTDRPGSSRCSATSRPNGRTSIRSGTRRCRAPSSHWSASATTACGYTPGSAMSPQRRARGLRPGDPQGPPGRTRAGPPAAACMASRAPSV